MSSNPRELTRQDLYSVAIYQKAVLWCILAYFVAIIAQFAVPADYRIFLSLVLIPVALAATIFVFLLAMRVYSVVIGIVLGVLTMIPCIGLITLLVINQKASGILAKHGYKVGLMGANLSEFQKDRIN
jgi:hypothetical protein